MSNKKFNLIFASIAVGLIVILINLVHQYIKNENDKIYFDLDDVTNINWIFDNNSFYITNKDVTLTLEDNIVINKQPMKFNNRTGEIVFNEKKSDLYLRSVSEDKIIIWYKKAEYTFEKEVIYE